MTNTTKGLIAFAVVAGIFGTLAFFGLTPFLKVITNIEQIAGTSPQGSTGTSAKQYNVYGVALSSPGTNATSSSVQNTTGNDLYISALKVGCEVVGSSNTAYVGGGLAALTVYAATTSTAAPAVMTNTNKIGGGNITISTSSPTFVSATSTAANAGTNQAYGIWPSNTYITFTTNATNTAVCTFGVDAFTS